MVLYCKFPVSGTKEGSYRITKLRLINKVTIMKIESDKIAIFLDVENLTKWINEDGPEHLLGEINAIGHPIVRRAYGNWTSNSVTNFQSYLNRLGFELIHTYHPISGKNSADIQMTVDVIEYAWNLKDISWFVLATGDSDFSPLFRRLREMGKGVIGVGPRSTLSETVKTSCSRYIYTESVIQKGDIAVQSAYEDAVDNTLKVLSIFGNKIHLSMLKAKVLNIDSAFDEKQLGFTSFSAFVESIENVVLSNKSTMCELSLIKPSDKKSNKSATEKQLDLTNTYISMLRKMNWRILPKGDLVKIFEQIKKSATTTKEKLTEDVLQNIGRDITPTDVRKAFAILIKSKIFTKLDIDPSTNETLWGIGNSAITTSQMLMARDVAIVSRIISACKDEKVTFEKSVVEKLLYSDEAHQKVDLIIKTAKATLQKTT